MLQHLNALSKDAADRNGEQLNSLEIHCTDVCAPAAYTMQSSDLQLVQDYLQTFTGRSRKAIACQHVIRSLAFVELNARIGMISDAHASTFDWIFEKDDLGFREWASNKNGETHSLLGKRPC